MRLAKYLVWNLLTGLVLMWTGAKAQTAADVRIDFEAKNKTLKEVFVSIEKSSGFHFIYNEDLVSAYRNVSIKAAGKSLAAVLNELLLPTNLQFLDQNKKIIISEKKEYHPRAMQEIIRGKVLEADSNKPVRNASIYFDGSLNGTASDSTGIFMLYPPPGGKSPIIVSAIGYELQTVPEYPLGKMLVIYLKPRQYELETVEIQANDGMSRRKKMTMFKNEFLGTTVNGRNSRIENEDDIRLNYNRKTQTLTASCKEPIIVHNKNLGYTFNFLLEKFSTSDTSTLFYGPQFFIENSDRKNIRKEERERAETYWGSRMHFIRSLWNNELIKNGFEIFGNNILKNKVGYNDIVVTIDGKKYIHLVENLKIVYRSRVSYLYKNDKYKDVFIDERGYNDPIGLDWGGVIGAQRAGDSLPLEYKPE